MKKRIIMLVLILATAAALWFASQQGLIFATKDTSAYSGTIEATLVPVQTEISGKVVELLITEGQEIKTGDTLAKLDDKAAKIALASAQSQLKQAENKLADLVGGTRAQEIRRLRANVDQVAAGLEQIKSTKEQLAAIVARDLENMKYEEKLLKDTDALFKEGALTDKELEAQTHKFNVAKAQYESSKAQYEGVNAQFKSAKAQQTSAQSNLDLALEGYTQPTILAQKAVVDVAQQSVKLAELNLEKTLIKSPVKGKVLHKHIELGQVVNPGSRITTLLAADDLWVKVYVPEAQLNEVADGKKAEIAVDAYPNKIFKGEIINIADKAEFTPKNVQTKEERTTIVFAVKVKLTEGFDLLRPGMPADVIFK